MCGWTCGSHLDFHGHLPGTCLTPGDDAMPNHSCSRPSWETRRPGGRPHASTPAGRDAGGAPGWDSPEFEPPSPALPLPSPMACSLWRPCQASTAWPSCPKKRNSHPPYSAASNSTPGILPKNTGAQPTQTLVPTCGERLYL